MARTTNTKPPSPNDEALRKDVQDLKVENASMKADKLGWKTGVKLHIASITLVLSIVGIGYFDLKGEIKQVETMVDRTHEIAVSTNAKVQALADFNIALQSGDPDAIDAARRALIDLASPATSETSGDTISDAGDTSSTTTQQPIPIPTQPIL